MNNEFKKTSSKDQTVYTLESASSGGTSSGSIASVSSPMGGMQRRPGDNLIAQEAGKKVPATTPRNFVAKNAKTGGAGAHKDKKKAEKQGSAKHKKPYMEALQARLDQLKSKVEEGSVVTHKGGEVSRKDGVTKHNAGPGVYGGYDASRHPDSPEEKHAGPRGAKAGHSSDKITKHKTAAEGYGEDDGIHLGAKVYHKEHQSGEPFKVAKIIDDQRVGVIDDYGNKKVMFINQLVPAQGVAEGRENYNGVNILFQKDDDEIFVKASAGGRELGHVLFVIDGDYLMPQDLEVEERFRGQGIAQTMYDYVKSKGYKIRRSGQQTDAGAGFWDKHKGQGQNVWEQGVAEGSLNEGQYEMMMRNGQVKKFIAKDDADAKRIAAGHGAKSVIRLKGGVPAGKVSEQGVAEGDNYMESLAEKLAATADVGDWVTDFKAADPNKYHQFKNKTDIKKQQMAVAAYYDSKQPKSKKK